MKASRCFHAAAGKRRHASRIEKTRHRTIVTRANIIVTFTEKDVPEEFVDAVRRDFAHYGAPPLVYEDYIDSLAKAGIPKTAKLLRQFKILMSSTDGEPRIIPAVNRQEVLSMRAGILVVMGPLWFSVHRLGNGNA